MVCWMENSIKIITELLSVPKRSMVYVVGGRVTLYQPVSHTYTLPNHCHQFSRLLLIQLPIPIFLLRTATSYSCQESLLRFDIDAGHQYCRKRPGKGVAFDYTSIKFLKYIPNNFKQTEFKIIINQTHFWNIW